MVIQHEGMPGELKIDSEEASVVVSKSLISPIGKCLARTANIPAVLVATILLVTTPVWSQNQIGLVHVTACGPQSFPSSTCTIPTTSTGNLLVVAWTSNNGGGGAVITSVADNANNVYAEAGNARAVDASANSMADVWYSKNIHSGATVVTVTPSLAGTTGTVVVWEFSGVDTLAPLDQTAVFNTQIATTTPSAAAVTTSAASEVVISVANIQGAVTGLIAGSLFSSDSIANGNGWAHLVTSTVGTYQAQWNNSVSGTYAASTVSFKAASSGSALNACDLNTDGVDNVLDVNRAVNMALALSPCAANINGPNICNIVTVQRVVNSSLPGGACIVDAASVIPTGLSCNPSSVNAPGTSSCTGTLSAAAPSGGLTLTLSSNNANAIVPSSVTAASGASTFGFTATVGSITTDQTAVLTASANGASPTASLSLTAPAQLSAVSCSPTAVGSGQTSICTVTLTKVATTATTVSLSSNVGTLSVPATLTISGAGSGAFVATAGTVGSNQTATITASLNGLSKTTTVSLTASVVSHSVTLTWVASTSANVAGYNVYRGTISGGPYATKVNPSLIAGLTYTDTAVLAGQTYYYVAKAVDTSGAESAPSTQVTAVIPTP